MLTTRTIGTIKLVKAPYCLLSFWRQTNVETSRDFQWSTVYVDITFNTFIFEGYKDGQVVSPNTFGQGSGPVWLETLSCVGNESTPLHCLSSGWNSSWESFSFYQCSGHSRDAAVRCYANLMGRYILSFFRVDIFSKYLQHYLT